MEDLLSKLFLKCAPPTPVGTAEYSTNFEYVRD
jgi:hypothetical protein